MGTTKPPDHPSTQPASPETIKGALAALKTEVEKHRNSMDAKEIDEDLGRIEQWLQTLDHPNLNQKDVNAMVINMKNLAAKYESRDKGTTQAQWIEKALKAKDKACEALANCGSDILKMIVQFLKNDHFLGKLLLAIANTKEARMTFVLKACKGKIKDLPPEKQTELLDALISKVQEEDALPAIENKYKANGHPVPIDLFEQYIKAYVAKQSGRMESIRDDDIKATTARLMNGVPPPQTAAPSTAPASPQGTPENVSIASLTLGRAVLSRTNNELTVTNGGETYRVQVKKGNDTSTAIQSLMKVRGQDTANLTALINGKEVSINMTQADIEGALNQTQTNKTIHKSAEGTIEFIRKI